MFPVICAQQRLVLFATKESTQQQGASQFGPALTDLYFPCGLLHNGQDGSSMTSWTSLIFLITSLHLFSCLVFVAWNVFFILQVCSHIWSFSCLPPATHAPKCHHFHSFVFLVFTRWVRRSLLVRLSSLICIYLFIYLILFQAILW